MSSNLRKIHFLFALWLTGALVVVVSEKSLTIYAQAVEARVTSVSGRAAIFGNGRSNARLARGVVLAPGDEVNTTGDGRVVIDLSDGSQVVVFRVRGWSSAITAMPHRFVNCCKLRSDVSESE